MHKKTYMLKEFSTNIKSFYYEKILYQIMIFISIVKLLPDFGVYISRHIS